MSNETETFMETVEAISAKRINTHTTKIGKGFDDRAAFEATHAPANTSIQTKLKAARAKLVLPGMAAVTLAANVDPNFMNTSGVSSSKRFNVYAIDKLADLVQGISSGHIKNAVNRAIVASLFNFDKAGVPFDGSAAQAAVSAQIKVANKDVSALLVRHTASPSTAATQTSSTMNALMVLGIVKNVASPKQPVWQLTDAPVVERLREVA